MSGTTKNPLSLFALLIAGCWIDDASFNSHVDGDSGWWVSDDSEDSPSGGDSTAETDEPATGDTGLFHIAATYGNRDDFIQKYGLSDTAAIQVSSSSWEGPAKYFNYSSSTFEYLCIYGYQTDGTPTDGCSDCDFAFEVETTSSWSYFDRCDALEAYGITPESFEGTEYWGYEDGADSIWTDYGYPTTGRIWYDYGAGWTYGSSVIYTIFANGGTTSAHLYMFFWLGFDYYYYQ